MKIFSGCLLIETMAFFIMLLSGASAMAAPTANPDNVVALKSEVVNLNVLANDTGEGQLLLGAIGPTSNIFKNFSVNGDIEITPFEDFVGRVTFVYTVVDDSRELARGLVTIDFIDPESDTNIVSPAVDYIAPINQLMYSTAAALDGHSRSISQFLTLRNSEHRLLRNMAYWSPKQGGAAGDGGGAKAGVFVSLKRQDLESKTVPDLEADIAGATLGFDYTINDYWFVGSALGYSDGEQRAGGEDALRPDYDMAEKTVIAFVGYNSDAWLADAQIGYSAARFDGNNCASSQSCEQAALEFDAQYAVFNGYYLWQANGWRVTPGLALKYQSQQLDPQSAQSLVTLDVSMRQRETKTLLSLAVDKSFNFNWGVVLPRIMATYNQQLSVNDKPANLSAKTEKHNANIDIGSSIIWPNDLMGFINMRTLVASDQYRSVSWEFGLRKAF